ncbi:MAG: DUF3052 domain-containing protein [Candidatus Saccharimonadia bacterium]
MQSSGSSNRSLADKLGIKMGENISIFHAPENYDDLIGNWPVGVSVSRDVYDEMFSFIHYFARGASELEHDLGKLVEHLLRDGSLWISWKKKSAARDSSFGETEVRALGLATGLVDVKVAAIDEEWSGLKFVRRSRDRI